MDYSTYIKVLSPCSCFLLKVLALIIATITEEQSDLAHRTKIHLGWKGIVAMIDVCAQVPFVFLLPGFPHSSPIPVPPQGCLGVAQWLLQPWSSHLNEEEGRV